MMTPRPGALPQSLALAQRAARASGRRLLAAASGPVRIASATRRDVKLDADRESERLIVRALRARSPYPVFGEEFGLSGSPRDDRVHWIVDPLDGSLNYSRGIPACCVSIALWRGDTPLLGVVYDFHRDEMFTGVLGRGAWLGDRPIRVSPVETRSKAVLCTGFPVSTDFSPRVLGEFVRGVRVYKKVRLLGTAALSLAYVAAGRADAYAERDIKIWDVAAGLALVLAAGGRVSVKAGKDPDCRRVLADNGRL